MRISKLSICLYLGIYNFKSNFKFTYLTVWWLWGYYHRLERRVPQDQKEPGGVCSWFIFPVLCGWTCQLYSRWLLLFPFARSLCRRLLDSGGRILRSDCRVLDLRNQSIQWGHQGYDWLSPGEVLAGLLAIRGTDFPALHHCIRPDWLWTFDLCGLRVSQLGQCAGMVYSWILGGDDTGGGNFQTSDNAGKLASKADHFNHTLAGSAIDGNGAERGHHRGHRGAANRHGNRQGTRRCLSSANGSFSNLLRLDLEIYQQLTFTYVLESHCMKVCVFGSTLGAGPGGPANFANNVLRFRHRRRNNPQARSASNHKN